jgi:hypothetical protein
MEYKIVKAPGIEMDKQTIFAFLKSARRPVLLKYLESAYRSMNDRQRRTVFAGAVLKPKKAPRIDAARLLRDVRHFHSDSIAGVYYAPFMINSKNFRDRPAETEDWCDRFGRFARKAIALTAAGQHKEAAECHRLLHDLWKRLDDGEEIIFADEAGSWMIPVAEKEWRAAHRTSREAVSKP